MIMKCYIAMGVIASIAASNAQASTKVVIAIDNPLPQPRTEMVEIDAKDIKGALGVLSDSQGFEVPWQLTFDDKLIFPASIPASGSATYTMSPGTPEKTDTIACASFHPERVDDIAWENDYAAYRAYGPAFGATGGAAHGYDVWTKSTTRPVVIERYINELQRGKSYHIDHGDGMDVYDVGRTLGGGAAALIDKDGNLIYPGCFSEWEILDNGPLRATLRLKFEYAGGEETRVITIDAGNPLNRTSVAFNGFAADSVAAGIVVHEPLQDAYTLADKYISVVDPTQKPGKGNGLIFVGLVNQARNARQQFMPYPENSAKIAGHALSVMPYCMGEQMTYYWGSCWNKGRVTTPEQWRMILDDFCNRLDNPLKIEVEIDE